MTHEYENLLALCPNCHRRAGKGDIDRRSLRIYKTNLRLAHDKFSQFEIDILFELSKHPPVAALAWPAYLNLLIKRLFDSDYVRLVDHEGGMYTGPVKLTPDFLVITDAGRAFITGLGLPHDDTEDTPHS